LARGAAGLTKFGHLLEGHAEGIPIRKGILALNSAHHGLLHGGDAPDVIEGSNVSRLDSRFLIKASVKLGPLITPAENSLEFFKLKLADLFVSKGFEYRVPVILP
jgi:hypothetical protein